MRDLGKLAVSNQILAKPDRPTEEEWAIIRGHPAFSKSILEKVEAFRCIAPIVGAQHERLDGGGYPGGLAAQDLCLEVRILTVADVFDALSADRPYRAALPTQKVLSIMVEGIGKAFDSNCVEALRRGLAGLETTAEP